MHKNYKQTKITSFVSN